MPSVEQEIKEGFDKIQNEFHNFKQENDARLKTIEKKGAAGADVEGKIDKHSAAIDTLVEKMEQMKTAMNRSASEVVAPEGSEKKLSQFMSTYMKKGDARIAPEMIKYYQEEMAKKGLSVGNDPEGGYLVRPEVSAQITTKIFESSPIRQLADIMVIGTDALEEPADFDEPDADWAGEVASVSETDENKLSMLRIATHELRANPRASQKILEDAYVDIEMWHANKVAAKFARSEASAFVTGNGVTKPRGFAAYSHGTSYGQVEQVAAAASGAIAADDLINLQYTLLDAYQPGAVWLMHRTSAKVVRKLKDGMGQYLWSMEGTLNGGFQQQLLGKPLYWASDMAEVAADSLSVAYGDFKQGYLIVDRVGISVLRDPYSAKPHVEFYTRKRVGGAVRNYQAIKLLKLATSVS